MTKLYVVERKFKNHEEVNKFFTKVSKKNYRGDSLMKSTFMHIVVNRSGKIETFTHDKRIDLYKIVTIEELMTLIEGDKKQSGELRKDFFNGKVAVTIEKHTLDVLNKFVKASNPKNHSLAVYDNVYYKITGTPNGLVKVCVDDNIKTVSITEILRKDHRKKVIGYVLKDPKQEALVKTLIAGTGYGLPLYTASKVISFEKNMNIINALKRLDVMDWFTEAYEKAPEPPQLPVVNGYKGVDNGATIQYGCATLDAGWFSNTANRHIRSMTLSSGVTIMQQDMDKIRDYLTKRK